MSYNKTMSQAFLAAKHKLETTGKFMFVNMIYECAGMTPLSIRTANRRLAEFNLVFKRYTGRGFWKHHGMVV
jgi:hypothetical protein